ncbi:enkurin domain-containing protein 1 isoform X2 [Erythrolamprus reginae]|uniref:enkurin domain-containing protein 1 isoform X2 n=1 Tax=Erythrolamprus reginae TaxID=121349 RepID=UPI00396C4AF9
MSEGPSRITGPIPPDPTLCPDYYIRPLSARGRLEGNALKLDLLPGPIPPEFSLYPGCYTARCPTPPPRIKPNGREILEKGQRGTVGVLLKLDEIFFEELKPKRRDHKDHEKENLRRMREIQRRCREKEQARQQTQSKPVKALWKSQKYENVESKVKAKLQVPENSSAVDFVSHNAQNAKHALIQRSRSLLSINKVLEQKQKDLEEYNTKQKGHVPHYLIERKYHWRKEAEERLRNTPDPDAPPGHALMPEHQRLETLKNLKESQEKHMKDLLLLPVRIDTLSVQTRRVSLEKKLSQIEEALKIFSRPKVFVKLDS